MPRTAWWCSKALTLSTCGWTPDAAEETSERLTTGAMKARGQLYFDSEA